MNNILSKVALITGASSGIGEGTAIAFAKLSYSLSLTGRNVDNLAKVSNECQKLGATEVLQITADLEKKEDIEKIMKKTIEKFGRLDVLVNNAGITTFGGIEHVNYDDLHQTLNINTVAPIYLTQLAVPHLEKSKGNIVNVSSLYSQMYSASPLLSYSISKAALDHFTKVAALDLAEKGIRVNSVNPGGVDTPIYERPNKIDDSGKVKQYLADKNILGKRMLHVHEITDAILFLASKEASMITGVILPVDGGRLLTGQ